VCECVSAPRSVAAAIAGVGVDDARARRTDYLAAASIATLWLNVSSSCFWLGFLNSMSGLVSQVSVCSVGGVGLCIDRDARVSSSQAIGAENYKLAGVWFQQTLLWFSVVCVGIACLWLETEDVLLALGFSRRSCELAGEYAR
jgi:hypothetical protein